MTVDGPQRLGAGPRGRRVGWRLQLSAMGLALATFAACSTVFDGELGTVRCEKEGAFGPPACRQGQTCVSGACADVGLPLGTDCDVDADCRQPWRCLAPNDMGQPGAPRCSATCCSSVDCGPLADGQVCWAPPGGGGAICWSGEALGRGSLGEGRMGDPCDQGGDCRSGLCDGGRCLDGCCDGSYCPPDELCRVKNTPLAEGDAWTCGKPPTGAPPVETCNTLDDCATAKCVSVEADLGICAQPCCSSYDCGSIIVGGVKRPVACTLVDAALRACGKLVETTSTGAVGSACDDDLDCRSGWCVDDGAGAYCTDLCCNDASCGDTSVFSCLPRPLEAFWALRCVRK